MHSDPKTLIKYSYNQLALKNLPCRYIFKDWKHIDKLLQNLPPGANILDIGCGDGMPISQYIVGKSFNLTGIDLSEKQIELAKNNIPQGNFLTMDMENITLPEKSFDALVIFNSLFHVPREYHQHLIKKFNSLLKNGGYLMMTLGLIEHESIDEEYEDIKLFKSQWGKEKNVQILIDSEFSLLYSENYKVGNLEQMLIFAKKISNDKRHTIYKDK